MKRQGIAALLMAGLLCIACASFAEPARPLRYLQLKEEQRIYTAPSEEAWVTGRPNAGQIVRIEKYPDDDETYWAYVAYRDQVTGIRSEGWLHTTTNVMPYDYLLSDYFRDGAEEGANQRLEAFCSVVDVEAEAPDYLFAEDYVGEAFLAKAEGIVHEDAIYIRVQIEDGYTAESFTHFVVTGEDGMPVARLNAVKTNPDTGINTHFAGVADYLPGTTWLHVYPVCDGQTEIDYQRCLTLFPEGWLRKDQSAPDDVYRMTGRPHKSLPKMQFTFEDTGRINAEDEHILNLSISAQDDTYRQEIVYASRETADRSLGLARLEDVNFDGYLDLVLAHALGASNWYAIFAPWLPEEGRFDEPIQDVRFCNHVLYPEQRIILSTEKDGAMSYYDKTYGWVGGKLTLMGASIMENSSSTEMMKERVVKYFSDGAVWVCWDDEYPIAWYDGNSRVWNERRETAMAMLIHGTRGHFAKVANVDWVNLRRQDSKQSESIAKLTAGTEVEILSYGCGEDRGWIRVMVEQEGKSLTGYIWKTYLQEIN